MVCTCTAKRFSTLQTKSTSRGHLPLCLIKTLRRARALATTFTRVAATTTSLSLSHRSMRVCKRVSCRGLNTQSPKCWTKPWPESLQHWRTSIPTMALSTTAVLPTLRLGVLTSLERQATTPEVSHLPEVHMEEASAPIIPKCT